MSADQKPFRIGFVFFVFAMIACSIANTYMVYKRDNAMLRLQARIEVLETKVKAIAWKSGI